MLPSCDLFRNLTLHLGKPPRVHHLPPLIIFISQYAFASQTKAHGFDPASAVLELEPRRGEYTLREADILDAIDREGDNIALVLFSGVQYYTGQWFPMESITRKAKEKVTSNDLDLYIKLTQPDLDL